MPVDEANRFAQAFNSLDNLIDTFRLSLFPIDQTHASSPLFSTVLLTHTLTHAATIQLHGAFVNDNPRSRTKSLSAAEACVTLLRQVDISNVAQINPLFGSLWTNVCRVFIEELQYRRSVRSGWAGGVANETRQEGELEGMLEKVFATMAVFSLDSPLMSKFPSSVIPGFGCQTDLILQITNSQKFKNCIKIVKCDSDYHNSMYQRVDSARDKHHRLDTSYIIVHFL